MYWVHRLFSFTLLVSLLGVVTRLLVAYAFGSRYYRGIRLIAGPPYSLDALVEVAEALELVRRADGRRFRRIEGTIKHIVLAAWGPKSVGSYWSLGKACHLMKLPVPEKSAFVATYAYASTLVHEATHGLLEKKMFPHTRSNRDRIEILCKREEMRFLIKLSGDKERWKTYGSYVAALVGKATGAER